MTTERQGWRISREVRVQDLVTAALLLITALSLVRKSELRFVGIEAATAANSEAIGALTSAVDKLAASQTDQHDWIITHDAKGGGR